MTAVQGCWCIGSVGGVRGRRRRVGHWGRSVSIRGRRKGITVGGTEGRDVATLIWRVPVGTVRRGVATLWLGVATLGWWVVVGGRSGLGAVRMCHWWCASTSASASASAPTSARWPITYSSI